VKTNKATATPGLRHDSHTLFQHSKVSLMFFLYVLDVCSFILLPRLFFFGKKKFIECFINAWINFLICSSYFHYGKGALLDGYKRNCPSQY
jgi:hypothetical protein